MPRSASTADSGVANAPNAYPLAVSRLSSAWLSR